MKKKRRKNNFEKCVLKMYAYYTHKTKKQKKTQE